MKVCVHGTPSHVDYCMGKVHGSGVIIFKPIVN